MSTDPVRRRSTPIPGFEETDPAVPGNWGAAPPPTPREFVSGHREMVAPVRPPGMAPPPGLAPGMPPPPPSGMPLTAASFGTAGIQMPPVGIPYVVPKRRRSVGGVLLVLLVFAGPLIGVGIGVWAFFEARDAIERSDDLTDPNLSAADRDALGLGGEVRTLFDAGAAPAVIAAFQAEIGGTATRFTEVSFYSDYAFATAQDPAVPTHIDRYQWRSAEVGEPSPERNDPDLERKLFGGDEVDWNTVAALSAAAPALLEVEQGEISHVIVDRTSSVDSALVVARVYVNGPRGSGFLEANALTGEVLRSF